MVAGTTVIGQATKYANTAKKWADISSCVAFVLLMGSAAYIIVVTVLFFLSTKNTPNIWDLGVRALLVLPLLAPALYGANFSKLQRDREFQLRDFAIKAEALEPYMEKLKIPTLDGIASEEERQLEAKKTEMTLALTKVFFDDAFHKAQSHHKELLIPKDVLKAITQMKELFQQDSPSKEEKSK